MSAPLRVEFELEKETPGTFKFKEVVDGEFDAPKIGALYVKKHALAEIPGYARDKNIVVLLSAGDDV